MATLTDDQAQLLEDTNFAVVGNVTPRDSPSASSRRSSRASRSTPVDRVIVRVKPDLIFDHR